jgi:hypothetical protein
MKKKVKNPVTLALVWTESIWKFFEFGLLLTKVGRDFAHLTLFQNMDIQNTCNGEWCQLDSYNSS